MLITFVVFITLNFVSIELPSLLPVVQVAEALLRLETGPYFLCRLIANMPDHFDQGEYLVSFSLFD